MGDGADSVFTGYYRQVPESEEKATEIASGDFPAEHHSAAERHIELCRTCHSRIVDGIELLDSDADARQAFAWMNRAMLEQQLHYDLAANQRREWETVGRELRLKTPYVAPNTDRPRQAKDVGDLFNSRSF